MMNRNNNSKKLDDTCYICGRTLNLNECFEDTINMIIFQINSIKQEIENVENIDRKNYVEFLVALRKHKEKPNFEFSAKTVERDFPDFKDKISNLKRLAGYKEFTREKDEDYINNTIARVEEIIKDDRYPQLHNLKQELEQLNKALISYKEPSYTKIVIDHSYNGFSLPDRISNYRNHEDESDNIFEKIGPNVIYLCKICDSMMSNYDRLTKI